MYLYKSSIISGNINKCGIYRITNLTSSKLYIGSSNNLGSRFRAYFNPNRLKRSNMYIYNAMLKHGYSNFSLDILEYCEPDALIKREQYYIDTLEPEYNILKIAGSSTGFKHSFKTRVLMSLNNRGENHPLYGKKPSWETRIKIGKANRFNSAIDIIPNLNANDAKLNSIRLSNCRKIKIKAFKSNNLIKEFSSIKSVALYLNVSTATVRNILKNKILHVGFTYKFEAVYNTVYTYDHNYTLLSVSDSIKKASILYKIPATTLSRYIKAGRLYNNKYYFCIGECK